MSGLVQMNGADLVANVWMEDSLLVLSDAHSQMIKCHPLPGSPTPHQLPGQLYHEGVIYLAGGRGLADTSTFSSLKWTQDASKIS